MKKQLTNWGNYPVVKTEDFKFQFEEEITNKIRDLKNYVPRGNGRCYGDAALSLNTLTTTSFNKILLFDHENGIFECQSGITLDQILTVIVPKGWFLPVTPGTKFITIGGAVASDVHGKNHHIDGSFSNHILEMEILLPNGNKIQASPSIYSDLFHATCGGMGLTGTILKVKFKLKKIETSFILQKQIKAKNLEEVLELFEKYKYYTYSVAWIDCLQKGSSFGRSILILGEHALTSDLSKKQSKFPLLVPQKNNLNFPFYLPSWALNKYSVKLFNTFFYNKTRHKEINNVVSYEPFFYPLDVINNWNRGYGRKGFVQYQFVVPLNAQKGLEDILHKISKKGLASFLAVLKIFGPQNSLISFPIQGFTLALDFPIKNGLFPFLDELDKIVIEYGGRIYMSKDARMKPNILNQGYPQISEFTRIVDLYNPQHDINSIQSNRLELTRKL